MTNNCCLNQITNHIRFLNATNLEIIELTKHYSEFKSVETSDSFSDNLDHVEHTVYLVFELY